MHADPLKQGGAGLDDLAVERDLRVVIRPAHEVIELVLVEAPRVVGLANEPAGVVVGNALPGSIASCCSGV